MTEFARQLRILLPLAVVALTTTAAEAGFLSTGPQSGDLLVNLSRDTVEVGVSSLKGSDHQKPEEVPSYLQRLTLDQLQVGNLPANGGMSSNGPVSSGGSSAPAAILSETALPTAGLISPFCRREIAFIPQSLIAEIFRPPCA